LTAVLIISWKHEIVGGVVFILAGMLMLVVNALRPMFEWYRLFWSLLVAGPAFLVGILFLVNWHQRKTARDTT
jgi:hypothetical protein